ncbi:MAG TPA: YceI family protein [Gemmatimonadales bacterium]|nr:YceI family protein [Gemmatimonadales bacterium]
MHCVQALYLAVVLAAEPALAAGQQPIPPGKVVSGTLSFDGRATAGDFTGKTSTVSGEMTGGADLSAVRGWVEAPAASLTTGNGRRDRDLNKSMETQKFPTMRFELGAVETAAAPDSAAGADSVPVRLKGRLTLHGVTRDMEIPGAVTLGPDGARVRGTLPVNLKDYHIGGLSKLFGTLRMYEDIVVHIDLQFAYAR